MIQFIKKVSGSGKEKENDCCGVEIKEVSVEENDSCCGSSEEETYCGSEKEADTCC
ncbi:hypothetical protein ACTWQL_02200 [Pseudalkalibacillus sp. R45]|uniref:hypothetical protein n=1 Tax=Pseudalkalibacillus sp. R45 TaxID=3457433 RepID=UPI003FCD3102